MAKINVITSFNIELEFESADFLKRFVAWLIDVIVVGAYCVIVGQILSAYAESHRETISSENLPFLYNLSAWVMIAYVPVLLYHLLCEIFMNGQSIGKKVMRMRVISDKGGRPTIDQYLLRWLMRPVDFIFTSCLGAAISYLSTKKNQRLGDMVAGTLMINIGEVANINETIFMENVQNYQPRYGNNVMRLSDRDMNLIKNVLDMQRKGYTPMLERTASKLRTILNINTNDSDVQLLETILRDYNHFANQ